MNLSKLALQPLAALCLVGAAAGAQPPAAPVGDALRDAMQTAEKNFVATAEAMPAGKYGYKPTAKHMTFGQHMLHMGDFNDTMCALIGGAQAPARAKREPTTPKAGIIRHLRESFTSCATALASLDDTQLGATVPFFGSQITRAQAVLILSGDWSDHYAVTATYLRLNGLLPPTAK